MKHVVAILALGAAPLCADEVYLRGGGQISGVIVSRTESALEVDIGGGTLTVQKSQVVRIEESISPLQEYRTRAAAVAPGDVEGWRELARWARGRSLSSQAKEAWRKVVELAPDDEEANRALGRVLLDGRWVTEEESCAARGFVEFEGHWVTPDERATYILERERQEEEDRRALEEEIAAAEAAEAEREAQEQAEHDAYWHSLPTPGDPLYWGSAVYWPTVPGSSIDRPRRQPGALR